jgi:hypothetical protein
MKAASAKAQHNEVCCGPLAAMGYWLAVSLLA